MGKNAFTLTELAVLTALFAVFALLVLPVLGGAREDEGSAVCMNNLRKMVQMGIMYSQDNDGRAPAGREYSGGGRGWSPADPYFTYTLVFPYFDYKMVRLGWGNENAVPVRATEFYCPSHLPPVPLNPDQAPFRNSYGVNMRMFRHLPVIGGGSMPAPSETVAYADNPGANTRLMAPGEFDSLEKFDESQGARHGGSINASFWDGSVRAVDKADVPYQPGETGGFPDNPYAGFVFWYGVSL